MKFNAVTLEMLWTRLISIVDEAAAALVRTSFSTIVRESNDFACVLTDARGRSLAQATDSIPSFIGTVPRTIKHFLKEFPLETLEPGDVLITNDIWLGTGHLPDITCAKPIFLKKKLVGFAGSAAQVPRSINVCLAYTIAYTSYGVKAVLSPNIPNNEGVLRPITITAPEGSIVNSTPPAAGGARALMGHFLPMMVITALAKAMPQKVVATIGSPLWCINLSGVRTNGKSFTNLFFMNGGFGAAHDRDGANVLSWPSNISSTPVEMIEQLSPLHVKHRRLRTDTGGRGQFRGGTGQEILFENRSELPLTVAFLAERTRAETAPAGIAGGEAGTPGAVLINGQRADPKVQHVVAPGSTMELKTPGGGGYGVVARRDAALIDGDIEDGYVSV